MANYKFELDKAGVGKLLKSEEMTEALLKEARKVLNRLPHGYGMSSGMTTQRAKVSVGTRTRAAASDNLKNNTLLKALGR